MIRPGETKESGAKRIWLLLSRTSTEVPAKAVGNGAFAVALIVAKSSPETLTIDSRASSPPL